MIGRLLVVAAVACGLFGARAEAAPLPASISAPAPFPLVTSTAFESEFVAPGVTRADYHLLTSSGPLHVSVVAVDPHEPTIRLDAVTAADRLISKGETVSAMAARTGAVAGINADYFDIGQTNQPLNIVVRGGAFERTPSGRASVTVEPDGALRFGTYRFAGRLHLASGDLPIAAVNESPSSGVTILTPAYGALPRSPALTIATLVPAQIGSDGLSGTYQIGAVGPADGSPIAEPVLVFGTAQTAAVPPPGDQLSLALSTDPPLGDAVAALGGGPLLIAGGAPVADPDAPAPEETSLRFPVAGIAREADGTILLIAVDGRLPLYSVGLTRPELGALMLGLGATDGMATDSGGSATLVARILGERLPSVLNKPSDGSERPVADGLFVYSTAPLGPPARLVVRPRTVRALPGATVTMHAAVTDAAGHLLDVSPPWSLSIASRSAPELGVERDGISVRVPIRVVPALAGLTIEPFRANPDPHAILVFSATGTDRGGAPVFVKGRVRWSATTGTIDRDGVFTAGKHDAIVIARAGGAEARIEVPVGRRDVPSPLFAAPPANWQFSTVPAGGPGDLSADSGCRCVRLRYDFGGSERAAYAAAPLALPYRTVGFGFDVLGDGNGTALRAALVDRDGRMLRATLARRIDWTGWRRVDARLPADLDPPVRLVSIYAVGTLGDAPVRASGTLAFRDASLLIAGTP